MNFRMVALVASMAVAMVACSPRVKRIESTTINNKQRLAETEIRLHNLETSLAHVQTQVSDLDHRNYEVRTRKGQKTGMVIVPVATPKPAPRASISTSSAAKADVGKKEAPEGKKIEPQKQTQPVDKTGPNVATQKAASVPPVSPKKEVPEAGPSGRLTAQNLRPDELALPPTEMPVQEPEKASLPVTAGETKQDTVGMPPVALPITEQTKTEAPAPQGTQASPVATPSVPKAVPSRAQQGEEAAYKAALNLARTGRSAEGIASFQEFLNTYPSGKYAPNAHFWIGECLYSQGKYQDALNMYQSVNDSYPKHHKNADALLKAGMSLSRLGNKDGASQKFRELKQSFPNSDAAKRVR